MSYVAAVLVASAFLFGGTVEVHAATQVEDDDRITWSTRPADEAGHDGRSWVEQTLAPGESVSEHMAVSNFSAESVTFSLTAADGYFTPTGRFNMLPQSEPSTAAGTWITVEDSVTVAPGETVVVPYTVTVPHDAEPGDHAAGIAASLLSESSNPDGTGVGVESRVGFRVMTRVTGDLRPAGVVENVVGSYDALWNPFRPGSAQVSFEVENTGNVRFLVDGTVSVGGHTVSAQQPDAQSQELLPGDRRSFTVTVDDVWPLFALPVTIAIDPTVVTLGGSEWAMNQVTAGAVIWAVPWSQLLVLLGLALAVGSFAWARNVSRRRIRTIVEEAREAGRRVAIEEIATGGTADSVSVDRRVSEKTADDSSDIAGTEPAPNSRREPRRSVESTNS
ncbi:COG1470 family protein [Microbacterium sp. CPCC 204701]|uniref:COG1470 family protein n=1 Tax=Microbacterium sp. CPCC 204701 TaxID=2493084 RepID=UPI00197C79FE|nr:hypothetical protein [Microbacterium sp. CPCC 204701]